MIDIFVANPLLEASKQFTLSPPAIVSSWENATDKTWRNKLIRSYPVSSPSSSREGVVANLDSIWLGTPASTSSETSLVELFSEFLSSDKYVSSINVHNPIDNLFELRNLTGLGWSDLAKLLDVSRRTLHNWIKAGNIRDRNKIKISETLKVLRYADRGCSEDNIVALYRVDSSGTTSFEKIKQGNYSVARSIIGRGKSHKLEVSSADVVFKRSNWTLAELVTHESVEYDDSLVELPREPKPASRKRMIKRG